MKEVKITHLYLSYLQAAQKKVSKIDLYKAFISEMQSGSSKPITSRDGSRRKRLRRLRHHHQRSILNH